MYRLIRRGGAVLIAAALVAIVVCDLNLPRFAAWWDRHAVTTSIVSSLLIVGATALIFNEVVAYRWGFASPDQFAAAYRQAYGVPPDRTLHQDSP